MKYLLSLCLIFIIFKIGNSTKGFKFNRFDTNGVAVQNNTKAVGDPLPWTYAVVSGLPNSEERTTALASILNPSATNQFVYIADNTGPFETTGNKLTINCVIETVDGDELTIVETTSNVDVLVISINSTKADTILCFLTWGTQYQYLTLFIYGVPDSWTEFEIFGFGDPTSIGSEVPLPYSIRS